LGLEAYAAGSADLVEKGKKNIITIIIIIIVVNDFFLKKSFCRNFGRASLILLLIW
jgi:hypothetical protein